MITLKQETSLQQILAELAWACAGGNEACMSIDEPKPFGGKVWVTSRQAAAFKPIEGSGPGHL